MAKFACPQSLQKTYQTALVLDHMAIKSCLEKVNSQENNLDLNNLAYLYG